MLSSGLHSKVIWLSVFLEEPQLSRSADLSAESVSLDMNLPISRLGVMSSCSILGLSGRKCCDGGEEGSPFRNFTFGLFSLYLVELSSEVRL